METFSPSAAPVRPVGDRAVVEALLAWRSAGSEVGLLTVACARHDAPCAPGTLLAVREDGATFGAVPRHRMDDLLAARLRTGRLPPAQPERISAPRMEFVLERLHDDAGLRQLHTALTRRAPRVRRLHLADGRVEIGLHGRDFHCDEALLERRFEPEWRLLLIGANELAANVVHCAAAIGFDITVCEPRDECRAAWNLGPGAHGVVIDPRAPLDLATQMAEDERTAIVGLSGDPTLEGPALTRALAGRAFYVAAVGAGSGPLPKFHGVRRPPAETAIMLLAEVAAARRRSQRTAPEALT